MDFFRLIELVACGLPEFDCSTVHDLGLLAMPLTFVSTSTPSPDCTYLSSFSFNSSASASVKGCNPHEPSDKELEREPQPFGHQHYLYSISKEGPIVRQTHGMTTKPHATMNDEAMGSADLLSTSPEQALERVEQGPVLRNGCDRRRKMGIDPSLLRGGRDCVRPLVESGCVVEISLPNPKASRRP